MHVGLLSKGKGDTNLCLSRQYGLFCTDIVRRRMIPGGVFVCAGMGCIVQLDR